MGSCTGQVLVNHHRGRLEQLCESTTRWTIEIARKERMILEAKREAVECLLKDDELQCLIVDWEAVIALIELKGGIQ